MLFCHLLNSYVSLAVQNVIIMLLGLRTQSRKQSGKPILKEDAKHMSNIYKLLQMANMLFWGACEQAGYVAILSSISMKDVRKLFPWDSLPHWVGFSEHEKVKFHHFLVILLWCNVLSSGTCLEYVECERNLIIACLPRARGACSPEVDLFYFLIGESWVF